jgi:hypothetical protein
MLKDIDARLLACAGRLSLASTMRCGFLAWISVVACRNSALDMGGGRGRSTVVDARSEFDVSLLTVAETEYQGFSRAPRKMTEQNELLIRPPRLTQFVNTRKLAEVLMHLLRIVVRDTHTNEQLRRPCACLVYILGIVLAGNIFKSPALGIRGHVNATGGPAPDSERSPVSTERDNTCRAC